MPSVVWCSPAPGQLGPLAESLMRLYHDIGIEHVVPAEPRVAEAKEVESQ